MTDETPEADRAEGAPHPRMAAAVFGQDAAAAAFLAAFNAGRLHHAWLMTGPRGVGKATLAWALARFLLATPDDDGGMFAPPPPATLDVPADHPVARRMRALAEPRLFLLRRPWDESAKRLKAVIPVDEVRRLQSFLRLSAADGGRRAVILDAADDMNPEAQNALLKLLEEPPRGVTFLLVAHQPMRLLPTIRSRCRTLPLAPLPPEALTAALAQAGVAGAGAALAELAGGSAGDAARLIEGGGVAVYAALAALFARAARGEGFDIAVTLIDRLLARAARAGATGAPPPEAVPGEAAALSRLAPDADAARAVAGLAQTLGARARAGRAVNLDPAALVLDMLLKVDAATAAPGRSR